MGGVPETPPRAWGRHLHFKTHPVFFGNTPTCVGKTRDPMGKSLPERKHPHVRGEDSEIKMSFTYRKETPPRAWGRPAPFAPVVK